MKQLSILLATTNPGKIKQYKEVLDMLRASTQGKSPVRFVPLSDAIMRKFNIPGEPKETGTSTSQNAIIKAEYYAKYTGMVTISDDGAFFVEDLLGAPGIRAHRSKLGPNEILKLLAKKQACTKGHDLKRRATMAATVACTLPTYEHCNMTFCATSIMRGTIMDPVWKDGEPIIQVRKRAKPYGYDGIFIPAEHNPFNRTVDTLVQISKRAHRINKFMSNHPLLDMRYPRIDALWHVLKAINDRR